MCRAADEHVSRAPKRDNSLSQVHGNPAWCTATWSLDLAGMDARSYLKPERSRPPEAAAEPRLEHSSRRPSRLGPRQLQARVRRLLEANVSARPQCWQVAS